MTEKYCLGYIKQTKNMRRVMRRHDFAKVQLSCNDTFQGGFSSKLTKRKMTFLPSSLKRFPCSRFLKLKCSLVVIPNSLAPRFLKLKCSLLVIPNSLEMFPVLPSSLKTNVPATQLPKTRDRVPNLLKSFVAYNPGCLIPGQSPKDTFAHAAA